jgi:lipopolysaccharide export system permease protein
MRLIDRYLLRGFLFWLAVCFGAFLLLWITFDLSLDLHRFQAAHLRGKDVIQYYFFEIPEFIPLALPVSILLAMLYSVTNHTRYNEVTAIRAAGVSLGRMCLPYFAAGLVLSVLLFAFNEGFAPQAGDKADEILRNDKSAKAERHLVKPLNFINYGIGGKGRAWQAAVYNTETHEMSLPLVSWSSTNSEMMMLSATEAVWTNGAWLFTGHVVETLRAGSDVTRVLATTNDVAMPEFTETPVEIQSDIKVNAFHSISTKTHRADIPLADIVNYLRFHPHPDRKMRNWLFTKLHGRFAGPFTCLVAVIVAIPFSARSGRRNIFVGVAASISIFFAYFVLQQVGLTFGETGWIPSWLGAWFPNLFFGLGGLALMTKVR